MLTLIMEHKSFCAASDNRSAKPRKAILALMLSICPGLGQQYAGHLCRGIVHYLTLIFVSWISALAFMDIESSYLSLAIILLPFTYACYVAIDAIYCARKQPVAYRLKWYNRGAAYMMVFAFLFVTVNPLMDWLIGSHIVRAYFVKTASMSPTLLPYDIVAINKLAEPDRNDIVLIGYDDDQTHPSISRVIEDQTLRRIIATPGDKVEVRGNKVYVNAQHLDEPYVTYVEGKSVNQFIDDKYTWGPGFVPENTFFVLSDAREYGFDSRVVGFINRNNVSGVASKVFWSWNFEEGRIRWERTAMTIN